MNADTGCWECLQLEGPGARKWGLGSAEPCNWYMCGLEQVTGHLWSSTFPTVKSITIPVKTDRQVSGLSLSPLSHWWGWGPDTVSALEESFSCLLHSRDLWVSWAPASLPLATRADYQQGSAHKPCRIFRGQWASRERPPSSIAQRATVYQLMPCARHTLHPHNSPVRAVWKMRSREVWSHAPGIQPVDPEGHDHLLSCLLGREQKAHSKRDPADGMWVCSLLQTNFLCLHSALFHLPWDQRLWTRSTVESRWVHCPGLCNHWGPAFSKPWAGICMGIYKGPGMIPTPYSIMCPLCGLANWASEKINNSLSSPNMWLQFSAKLMAGSSQPSKLAMLTSPSHWATGDPNRRIAAAALTSSNCREHLLG